MDNKYDDFDLELSESMLDDIEDTPIDDPKEEEQEPTPPPKKKAPRKIKTLVVSTAIVIIILIMLVKFLGGITRRSDAPIVDSVNNGSNVTIVSSSDTVNPEEESFEIKGITKDDKGNQGSGENIGLIPNIGDMNNKNGNNEDVFEVNGDETNNNNTFITGDIINNGNNGNNVPTPPQPEVIYPKKKNITIMTGNTQNNTNTSSTNSTGSTNSNSGTSTNVDPSEVVKNEPKDLASRNKYYASQMGQKDYINAYNLGMTNEEYYKTYIAGSSNSALLGKFNTGGAVADSNTNKVVVNNKNDWGARQTGIKMVESFDLYDIKEGSYIPVTIATQVRTDKPGMFQAIVREDVYDSVDHKYTLIPMGSRLIGKYETLASKDAKYVNMLVHRIILPNGKSINLQGFDISDLKGSKGGVGYKDEKYGERLLNSGLALAVGLTSDFIGNASLGTNGFSLGRKHFDYKLNRLEPPKQTSGNNNGGGHKTDNPDINIDKVTNNSRISVRDTRNVIMALQRSPLSKGLKADLLNRYGRVYNESRNVQENILGYLLAKAIYDGLNSAINGNGTGTTGDTTSGGTTGGNGVATVGDSDIIRDALSGNNSNPINSILDLLGSGGNTNGNNLGGLGSLLGGTGNSGLGGITNLDQLKALIKGNQVEDERELLGTNNIVKDVKSTLSEVKNAWNSVTPVIYIEPGARLNLYVSADLSLEPYMNKTSQK